MRANIIPCLRYRDAPAAIEWLCQSFGFTRGAIYPGEHDTIVHAELSFGNGMIMLGSASRTNEPYSQLLRHPDELGGVATQTTYVVVQDAHIWTFGTYDPYASTA